MGSKFRTLWEKIKIHSVRTVLIALFVILIVLIILIILGYIFNWDWTGLNATDFTTTPQNVTRTIVYQQGKTLWDWLQLLGVLAIPVVVGFGAVWFTTRQGKVSDRENTDNQRETALQAYFDKMSELLLKEHLGERTADGKLNPEYEQVRKIARIRTITVLNQLDARRIGYVFTFLRETELMSTISDNNMVSLDGADLHSVNWSQAELMNANLSGVNLSGANLTGADFMNTNLSGAKLLEANLSGADFYLANLSNAKLSGADLRGTYLYRADLTLADLGETFYGGAFFTEARHISSANLSGANLTKANLSGTNLSGVDLSGADMTGAYSVSNGEIIKQAKSLKGAIMIDGSKHP